MSEPRYPDLRESVVLHALDGAPRDSFLVRYVDWVMKRNDAHAVFQIATGLALITQTCHLDGCLDLNKRIYQTIYAVCIGPSTDSRKTTAIEIGCNLLRDALPDAIQAHPDSKQGLIKGMGRKQRQLLDLAEFGDSLCTWSQSYAAPIKTALTAAYDGGTISRGTSKELDIIAKPRLSIIAGVAPSFLEAHTLEQDWLTGFLARFAFFFGERERLVDMHSLELAAAAADPRERAELVKLLVEMRKDGDRPAVGRCLGFDDEARVALDEWKTWQQNCAATGSEAVLASIGRANDLVFKIAQLLAWNAGYARLGCDWTLHAPEIKGAIVLAKHHCRSSILVQGNIAATPFARDRRAVLNQISTNQFQPTLLHTIIKNTKLGYKRVVEHLLSLKAERTICSRGVSDEWQGAVIEGEGYWSVEQRIPLFSEGVVDVDVATTAEKEEEEDQTSASAISSAPKLALVPALADEVDELAEADSETMPEPEVVDALSTPFDPSTVVEDESADVFARDAAISASLALNSASIAACSSSVGGDGAGSCSLANTASTDDIEDF